MVRASQMRVGFGRPKSPTSSKQTKSVRGRHVSNQLQRDGSDRRNKVFATNLRAVNLDIDGTLVEVGGPKLEVGVGTQGVQSADIGQLVDGATDD